MRSKLYSRHGNLLTIFQNSFYFRTPALKHILTDHALSFSPSAVNYTNFNFINFGNLFVCFNFLRLHFTFTRIYCPFNYCPCNNTIVFYFCFAISLYPTKSCLVFSFSISWMTMISYFKFPFFSHLLIFFQF